MHDILTVTIPYFLLGLGCLPLVDFLRSRLIHYQLGDDGVVYTGVLGRYPIIPYKQIESVRVFSWLDYYRIRREVGWFKMRSRATKDFTRRLVLVKHRDGRGFILTPSNPDAFVANLNERISAAGRLTSA